MPLSLERETVDRLLLCLFDRLDLGVALIRWEEARQDFLFLRVNPFFVGLFGGREEDFPGRGFCEWEHEPRLHLTEFLSRVRSQGEKSRTGANIDGDRWFQLTGIPLGEETFCLSVTETTAAERVHRELSRSHDLFRNLVEETGAFFCEYAPGGTLTYVNRAYCDFLGVHEEDVLGKDFYRYIPSDQREAVKAGIEALSPEAPSHSCEHQVRLGDGRMTWQRWMDRAFFDAEGRVRTCCSVGFDITAQREAGERRREQARHFEALFEYAPVAVCFSLDYRVFQVNPAFCSLFRMTPEDILGRDMRKVISLSEPMRRESGELVELMDRGERFLRDTVRCRSDGEQVRVRITGVPYGMTDGKRGYFVFFQDLSDTVELEKEMLRNSIVVEESPVVIFEAPLGFGSPCRFISENVSQFGYKAEDLMWGKISLDMRTHPEDMQRLSREVAEANSEGRSYREYTYRLLTTEGRYRWINERNRVIPGPDGEPESIIGVLIDQTELIKAQQKLQSNNERLARHASEMEDAWDQTILLLAGVTEMRDPYTRGHQFRVADLCRAIAEEMAFQDEPLKELVQAAHIHDIGKMEIPSDYLNRPGKLLPEEFEFIKDHPAKGYELLSRLRVPGFLPEIVYQHHERLDGSGYPRGLHSEDILLPARVLAVADVIEAMLSHRPYRPAFALDEVMAEINHGAGTLYDEDVVSVCRHLFREKGYRFPEIPEEII